MQSASGRSGPASFLFHTLKFLQETYHPPSWVAEAAKCLSSSTPNSNTAYGTDSIAPFPYHSFHQATTSLRDEVIHTVALSYSSRASIGTTVLPVLSDSAHIYRFSCLRRTTRLPVFRPLWVTSASRTVSCSDLLRHHARPPTRGFLCPAFPFPALEPVTLRSARSAGSFGRSMIECPCVHTRQAPSLHPPPNHSCHPILPYQATSVLIERPIPGISSCSGVPNASIKAP